jgi:hypothetical protein
MVQFKDVLKSYNINVDTDSIVKIGDTSNYQQIDGDGYLISKGNSSQWEDLIPTVIIGTGSLTPPNLTLVGNNKCYGFSSSGVDELTLLWEILHGLKMGQTAVDIHFHYVLPTSTDNKNIGFTIEMLKLPNSGIQYTTAQTFNVTIPVMANSNKTMNIGIFTTTFDISDLTVGDQISGRFIRNNAVSNNLSADVGITQVAMHCLFDSQGSNNRTSKTI